MKLPDNPRTKFAFLSDPEHGWLLISPDELAAVGMSEDDITAHSYKHETDNIITLEEDVDMPQFLRAWEQMIGRPVEIEDAVEGIKFIRCWPSFGRKASTAGQEVAA